MTLPRGIVDLGRDIPGQDYHLIAPTATLVAREDLHPALVGLLVKSAGEIHGKAGWFQQQGQFPSPKYTEIPVARELNPDLYILARTRYVAEIDDLLAVGADEVIPDELGAGLELAWNRQCAVHFTFALLSFQRRWPCEALVLPLSHAPGEAPLLLVGQIFPRDMPRFRRSLENPG